MEATYLAATMELVKRCSVIMKSQSHLSHLMHRLMCAGRKGYDDNDYVCPDAVIVGKNDHEERVSETANSSTRNT